jgi:SAM-dependent methyltransferase
MIEPPCDVCGGSSFGSVKSVLWQELIGDWQLSPFEAEYIDEQQGLCCQGCGSNLRSIVLASAVRHFLGFDRPLRDHAATIKSSTLKVLEINEAGSLTPVLSEFPGYAFVAYPDVDIHRLPYEPHSFDIVCHSDTLEHVPNPVHALAECRRVLRPGGALCFTVPIVIGRLTRSRAGLKASYHGAASTDRDDYLVHTEYGADVWTEVFEAGFASVAFFARRFPAALALLALR